MKIKRLGIRKAKTDGYYGLADVKDGSNMLAAKKRGYIKTTAKRDVKNGGIYKQQFKWTPSHN